MVHEDVREVSEVPQDLGLVQRDQVHAVHHRVETQTRLPTLMGVQVEQYLRGLQGPVRRARNLGHDGIHRPDISRSFWITKAGRTLLPARPA
jgi:hypothetical protein